MNLNFANPLVLWGLLAAALPIIIHLINRRRARIVNFAATYFVLLTNKRLARSLKLKQFLLLLFRTLLILALVFLVARPFTTPPIVDVASAATSQPTTRILIVDHSLSMRAKFEGDTLFKLAKTRAKELILGFGESDNFALIPAPLSEGAEAVGLTFKRSEILTALDTLEPGLAATDFSVALDKARLLLDESALPEKRVYLFGDFTTVGYDADFSLTSNDEPVLVATVDVRKSKPIANAAVVDIQAGRSFFTGPRDWKVSVSVANYGPADIPSLPISLTTDGSESASGFMNLKSGETATKEFILRLDDTGTRILTASIPDDALAEDNKSSVALNVSQTINALIVNGQPSATRHRDEIFYLSEALNPGDLGRSQIHPTVIGSELLDTQDLSVFNLVFLAQVPNLTDTGASMLKDFVQAGGGLIISTGPALDIDSYNEKLSELLPGRFRGAHAAGSGPGHRKGDAVFLSRLDYHNPAFAAFNDDTAKSLYEAPVFNYLTFDPDARRSKKILAEYSDGSPALISVHAGMGRSLLITTTISRTWNDLPIQPGFLPMIQELVRLTASGEGARTDVRLRVGGRYRSTDGAEITSIIAPDGKAVKKKKGEEIDISPPLAQTGLYLISTSKGEAGVNVTLEPTESDLRPLTAAAKEAAFGAGATLASADGTLPETRVEYAGMLAWLALLLFAAEIAVLRWMG